MRYILIINITNKLTNHFNNVEDLNLKIERDDSVDENIYNRFYMMAFL